MLLPLLGACALWLGSVEVADWVEGANCPSAEREGAEGCQTFYEDRDADGWGGPLERCLCAATPEFPTPVPGDCADDDPSVNPDAAEQCDELAVDEDCDVTTPNQDVLYYYDADGDSFGTATTERHCAPTELFRALTAGDCADEDAAVNPDAVEICNGRDDDCDGETSEDGMVTGDDGVPRYDLQAAVDATPEGGTVSVCAGSFGAVTVEHTLTLVGIHGAEVTVIDAGGSGSALTVLGGEVRLEQLTLTGGAGTAIGDLDLGGGAFVLEGASLILDHCVVRGNHVDNGHGGGIYATGALTLTGSQVYDNSASGQGGGLHADGPTLTLTDSNVFYNQAGWGAGLDVLSATVDLTGTQVAGNFGDNGGGVAVSGETEITGGTVSSNSASLAGAGIYVGAGAGTLRLIDVRVEDNVSVTDGGGGVALASGTLISVGSDWVDAETDCYRSNYPNDVYTITDRYCASEDADFTCTAAGCEGDVYSNCDCIRR